MTFQEQLITFRKQQGLSQEQLDEKLGVTRQTVSKWELGVTTPEMDKLILLADLFNISIDDLVGREAPDTRSEATQDNEIPPVREIRYVPYPWHYEYKSSRTLFGLPLIHINLGRWLPGQKRCRAKGIIAIGNFATGILSLGGFSSGVFAVGGFSAGLFSLGGCPWDCFSPSAGSPWGPLQWADWLSGSLPSAEAPLGSMPWAERQWLRRSPPEAPPGPSSPSGTQRAARLPST